MLISKGLLLSTRRTGALGSTFPSLLLLNRSVSFSSPKNNAQPIGLRSWLSTKENDETEQDKEKSSSSEEPPKSNGNGYNRKRDDLQRIRDELPVTFADISRAQVAVRDGVVRTKCEKSYFLSELTGCNIYIKPEFRQFTGSFKERGARNAILQLKRDLGPGLKGVIAASAGNHALALAYHGKLLDVPITVVMPIVAPLAKVDKCRVSLLYVYVQCAIGRAMLWCYRKMIILAHRDFHCTHHSCIDIWGRSHH